MRECTCVATPLLSPPKRRPTVAACWPVSCLLCLIKCLSAPCLKEVLSFFLSLPFRSLLLPSICSIVSFVFVCLFLFLFIFLSSFAGVTSVCIVYICECACASVCESLCVYVCDLECMFACAYVPVEVSYR